MSKDSSRQESIEKLELILSESKNLRKETIENIDKNVDLVWKQISLLTFLLGVFLALSKFVYAEKMETEIFTFLLAYGYVFVTLLLSLYEIYPKEKSRSMTANGIYEQCEHDRCSILQNLIETYLINVNKMKKIAARIIFVRKCITLLTFGFVLQVSLIVYYYLNRNFDLHAFLSLVLLAILTTLLFICYSEYKDRDFEDTN